MRSLLTLSTFALAVLTSAAAPLPAAKDSAAPAATPAKAEKAPEATTIRLTHFLWRDVVDNQGQKLGAINDVLAEMPSGRIVFILVKPDRLYAEPKAIPPAVLFFPADPQLPARLDITHERWLDAPHLGWNPEQVVKGTERGQKIYAYYQQQWLGTTPDANNVGMNVVATRGRPNAAQSEPARFVSLKTTKYTRVACPAWGQDGFLCGFLVDWQNRRVSSALVSRWFPPIAPSSNDWFAVPVERLNPPTDREALTINVSAEAFDRAPKWEPNAALPAGVFRYPAPANPAPKASAPPART